MIELTIDYALGLNCAAQFGATSPSMPSTLQSAWHAETMWRLPYLAVRTWPGCLPREWALSIQTSTHVHDVVQLLFVLCSVYSRWVPLQRNPHVLLLGYVREDKNSNEDVFYNLDQSGVGLPLRLHHQ